LKYYWQVELERVLRIQKELEKRINEQQILNDEQQENHRNAKTESRKA